MPFFIRQAFTFFLHLFISFTVFSQAENPKGGARSEGMGNASVTISDEWALLNNISGIASVEKPVAALAYQNRWNISGFNSASLAFAYPTKYGVPGISFTRFGDHYYNEQLAGIGYGHKIRNVSLGIKVNYLQIVMEEVSTKRNLLIEFGGIAEITPELIFGAHIYNLNQARLKSQDGNLYVPVVMKAGLSYRPSKQFMFNGEIEKNISYQHTFRFGIEYIIIPKFKLRTGVSTFPFVNYFGLGFLHKYFQIDYAFNFHKALGSAQQISLAYKFKHK